MIRLHGTQNGTDIMRRSHFIFALALFTATPAIAQQTVTLEVMAGVVLVDSPAGLAKADATTTLKTGDRLYLKSGSAALLSNVENGCFVSLRSAGKYVVPDMADCVSGHASVMPSNFVVEPTNGQPMPMEAYAADSFMPVAVGVSFAAIAAGAAIYTTVIENDTKPAAVSIP
jgi:hypothetical protein